MATSYEGSSERYDYIVSRLNLVFTAIFILEMVLKLLALGFKGYWFNGWNRFDAFVVLASIVDLLMDALGQDFISFLRVGPQLARVLRVLRVSRLFKLIKSFEGLASLIETLAFSLPSLMNVFALLLLVYFVFSILGVFLFRNIHTGDAIDGYANFSNFGMAMITLFRCSTGEDWFKIMYDTMRTEPNCTKGVNCGSSKLC